MLSIAEGHLSLSTRAINQQVGFSHTTVLKILPENKMILYHLRRAQELQPEDYPHGKTFSESYLQQIAVDNTFATFVLFTDEATFTKEGPFNKHNAHVRASANPMIRDYVLLKDVFLSMFGLALLEITS